MDTLICLGFDFFVKSVTLGVQKSMGGSRNEPVRGRVLPAKRSVDFVLQLCEKGPPLVVFLVIVVRSHYVVCH